MLESRLSPFVLVWPQSIYDLLWNCLAGFLPLSPLFLSKTISTLSVFATLIVYTYYAYLV